MLFCVSWNVLPPRKSSYWLTQFLEDKGDNVIEMRIFDTFIVITITQVIIIHFFKHISIWVFGNHLCDIDSRFLLDFVSQWPPWRGAGLPPNLIRSVLGAATRPHYIVNQGCYQTSTPNALLTTASRLLIYMQPQAFQLQCPIARNFALLGNFIGRIQHANVIHMRNNWTLVHSIILLVVSRDVTNRKYVSRNYTHNIE